MGSHPSAPVTRHSSTPCEPNLTDPGSQPWKVHDPAAQPAPFSTKQACNCDASLPRIAPLTPRQRAVDRPVLRSANALSAVDREPRFAFSLLALMEFVHYVVMLAY